MKRCEHRRCRKIADGEFNQSDAHGGQATVAIEHLQCLDCGHLFARDRRQAP